MKVALVLITSISLFFGTFLATNNSKIMNAKPSIYDISITGLTGEKIDLSTFKGKKILIVNTASECGFTKQFADLQKLHEKYQDKLVIIGVPCNQFGGQEPGSNKDIATFCQKNYGVSFPMMSKISVKGKDMHPVYHFLTEKDKNGLEDSKVEWNFQKYLIDENGHLEKVISPRIQPDDESITSWIEK